MGRVIVSKKQASLVFLVALIYIASMTGCANNSGSAPSQLPATQITIRETPTVKMISPIPADSKTENKESGEAGTAGELDLSKETLVEKIKIDLAKRLSVNVEKLEVVKVDIAEWPDTSLGCPRPGEDYFDRIMPGYLIVIRAKGQLYEYHSDEYGHFVLCDTGESFVEPVPIMPVAPHGKLPKCQWTPCP